MTAPLEGAKVVRQVATTGWVLKIVFGAKQIFNFFSPKAFIFFVHFWEGNGLLGEVVVGKIDFIYTFYLFLSIFGHFYSFYSFILHCVGVFDHFSDIFSTHPVVATCRTTFAPSKGAVTFQVWRN